MEIAWHDKDSALHRPLVPKRKLNFFAELKTEVTQYSDVLLERVSLKLT